MGNVTKDFNSSEFACNCCGDNYTFDNLMSICIPLQAMRDDVGSSIVVTSGYRCASHNADVGGVVNSQHLVGCAVDIYCDDLSPTSLAMLAFRHGFRYIGIGADFVHLDMRSFNFPVRDCCIWHY